MTQHNPLFPNSEPPEKPASPFMRANPEKVIQPLKNAEEIKQERPPRAEAGRDAAANVIRQKLEAIYADEPSAQEELTEVSHHHEKPSKHQEYLTKLQKEATSVAEIQTRWHEYYAGLPEAEKHEVWQEFYAEQAKHSRYSTFVERKEKQPETKAVVHTAPHHHEPSTSSASRKRVLDSRSTREIKNSIRNKVTADGKLKAKHHLQSLFFGLGMGAIVLLIMMFGLFNQMIIAPFIQPNRSVSATPIILGADGIVPSDEPKIIIPKINVEIPVDYSLTSLKEDVVQKGLENGVVHYPVTSKPGEKGNAAFFGHSSNNIFNPGKYKFAFVLLNKLEDGDMFYMTYDKQVYAYRVFQKKVVNPDDIWVLNPVEGKTSTATLITCDPPGTTLYRLVVWGEQVSPDPIDAAPTSAAPVETSESDTKEDLPGAPKPIWQRFTDWLF